MEKQGKLAVGRAWNVAYNCPIIGCLLPARGAGPGAELLGRTGAAAELSSDSTHFRAKLFLHPQQESIPVAAPVLDLHPTSIHTNQYSTSSRMVRD